MDNNKKPSEPVEEERWALKDVPTGELLKELIRHDDVRILSLHHDQKRCREYLHIFTNRILRMLRSAGFS